MLLRKLTENMPYLTETRGNMDTEILSLCSNSREKAEGGLFFFCELEEGRNALELLKKAVEKKVAYVPGTHFYAGGGHDHTFRLNFSMPSVEQIKLGMAALNEVFSEK